MDELSHAYVVRATSKHVEQVGERIPRKVSRAEAHPNEGLWVTRKKM